MEAIKTRQIRRILTLIALVALLPLAGGIAMAEDDLTDNAVCLECHEGGEVTGSLNVETDVKVHETTGSHLIEAHDMWSCVDCHTDITEIPHPEGVERTVDCLSCHEEMPKGE